MFPYSSLFGCEARVDLTSLYLPTEVINTLESEYHLAAILLLVTHSPTASTDDLLTHLISHH